MSTLTNETVLTLGVDLQVTGAPVLEPSNIYDSSTRYARFEEDEAELINVKATFVSLEGSTLSIVKQFAEEVSEDEALKWMNALSNSSVLLMDHVKMKVIELKVQGIKSYDYD